FFVQYSSFNQYQLFVAKKDNKEKDLQLTRRTRRTIMNIEFRAPDFLSSFSCLLSSNSYVTIFSFVKILKIRTVSS
ncbi:hypothetical protein KA005_74810, partial [bacterium]|nr:hypothetical protein [bacterium]